MSLRTAPLVALAAVLLLGCGVGDGTGRGGSGYGGTPAAGDDGRPQVREAVADLAAREGVAESDVRVESVTEVTWSDGSLGCARPGEMYAQALVDGLEIVLSVGAARYPYHSSLEGEPFLCERPTQRPGRAQPSKDG